MESIGSMVAPGKSQRNGSACSVDLKLGGGFGREEQGEASGSSKRPRAQGGASQNVACMVDGCTSDLSSSKEYHRRHKVCEAHSKTPMVLVGGQQQRFCQQCSRFHSLVEFDEVKRSCRKRLDGHNRRRRKPQPGPEAVSNSRFLPSLQGWNLHLPGTRYLPIPSVFSVTTQCPGWASDASNAEDILYSHNTEAHLITRQQVPPFYPTAYKEGKPCPFLTTTGAAISCGTTLDAVSIHQSIPEGIPFMESSAASSKIFADGPSQVLKSNCALSLLSSTSRTSDINPGQMVVSINHLPIPQSLPAQPLQQYCEIDGFPSSNNKVMEFCSQANDDNDRLDTILSSDTDLHCHGGFHGRGMGSSRGPSHALPFSWQ